MEHRWGRRQAANLRVRIVTDPAKIATGRVLNISVTGAYLQTNVDLRLLSVVYLSSIASRPAKARNKGMAACVVRRDATGVGLEWCEAQAERMSVATRLALLSAQAGVTPPLDVVTEPARSAVEAPIATQHSTCP